jgi:pimeloyl-ACP methyl ester carboxylesterase
MNTVTRPDGAQIAWYDEGSGPAVLLVMGLAYPAAAWFRQVPVLAEHHRVITVDNRGCGGTGDAPGAPYTVELMTDDLLAVLDAAGEERAHVAGISLGGLLAQCLAQTAPERVLSLALLATHAGFGHTVWPEEVLAFLAARQGMSAEDRGEFSIPFNFHPDTPRELIEQDWRAREAGTAGPVGYAAQGGTAAWSGYERLATMTVPTLVMAGAQDRLLVPENSELLAAAIPDATLVLVEGANHILTTDRTDEVNRLLLAHFAEHPS